MALHIPKGARRNQDRPLACHPVYHDHSSDVLQWTVEQQCENVNISMPRAYDIFPLRLHRMLNHKSNDPDPDPMIQWLPHGRAFKVLDRHRLVAELLPTYFDGQSKYGSFQRQLNNYGFVQLTGSHDEKGAYYHERFLRGLPLLSITMTRWKQAPCSVRRKFDPASEPIFFLMPALPSVATTFSNRTDASRPSDDHNEAANDALVVSNEAGLETHYLSMQPIELLHSAWYNTASSVPGEDSVHVVTPSRSASVETTPKECEACHIGNLQILDMDCAPQEGVLDHECGSLMTDYDVASQMMFDAHDGDTSHCHWVASSPPGGYMDQPSEPWQHTASVVYTAYALESADFM